MIRHGSSTQAVLDCATEPSKDESMVGNSTLKRLGAQADPLFEIQVAVAKHEHDLAIHKSEALLRSWTDMSPVGLVGKSKVELFQLLSYCGRARHRGNHEQEANFAKLGVGVLDTFRVLADELVQSDPELRCSLRFDKMLSVWRAFLEWRHVFAALQFQGYGSAEGRIRQACAEKEETFLKELNDYAIWRLDALQPDEDRDPISQVFKALRLPAVAVVVLDAIEVDPSALSSPSRLRQILFSAMGLVLRGGERRWIHQVFHELAKTGSPMQIIDGEVMDARAKYLREPIAVAVDQAIVEARRQVLSQELEDYYREQVGQILIECGFKIARKWNVESLAETPEASALAKLELIKAIVEGPLKRLLWCLLFLLEGKRLPKRAPMLGEVLRKLEKTNLVSHWRAELRDIRNAVAHEDVESRGDGTLILTQQDYTRTRVPPELLDQHLERCLAWMGTLFACVNLAERHEEGQTERS